MRGRKAASVPKLAELDTTPLHERAYQEIKEALMSGHFHPGQKLTSRTLAKALGISDMPVRSALLRLSAQQALTLTPSGIAKVPNMFKERFAELMALRVVLEGRATEQVADKASKSQLRTIEKLCHELTSAARNEDIARYLTKNKEFKFAIYNIAPNSTLLFLIEILWLQVGPFLTRYAGQFEGKLTGILEIDYHEDAVAALKARASAAARTAIEQDIAEGAKFLLEHAKFEADQPS